MNPAYVYERLGLVVRVRYLGPTNHKGARWSVQSAGFPRKFFPMNHELEHSVDAFRVVEEYAKIMKLTGDVVACGWFKDEFYAILL